MFEVYCPAHRARVLLTMRRIVALYATATGVVVDWRCWCGQHGRSVQGRRLGPGGDPDRDGAGHPPPLPAVS